MEFSDSLIAKSLPLFNKTALWLYTLDDFFKPGPQDVLQSTLPFYELGLMMVAFTMFTVIFIYLWKLVYYMLDDTYATPYGTSLPYEWRKRSLDQMTTTRILNYIHDFLS